MGAKVTIWARKMNQLKEAANEIGGSVHYESVDVVDLKNVQAGLESSVKTQGPVDYLICCAGITRPGYIEDLDVSVFESLMKVNYMGSVNTVKAALPHMMERKSVRVSF